MSGVATNTSPQPDFHQISDETISSEYCQFSERFKPESTDEADALQYNQFSDGIARKIRVSANVSLSNFMEKISVYHGQDIFMTELEDLTNLRNTLGDGDSKEVQIGMVVSKTELDSMKQPWQKDRSLAHGIMALYLISTSEYSLDNATNMMVLINNSTQDAEFYQYFARGKLTVVKARSDNENLRFVPTDVTDKMARDGVSIAQIRDAYRNIR